MTDTRPTRHPSFVIRISSLIRDSGFVIRHSGFVIRHSPLLLALLVLIAGCSGSDSKPPAPPLVVYTSVDEPYARPILLEFTNRTGITVVIRSDTEATKSVGLAARLEAERDKPRADVWWGNEVFHTIRLAEAGVLAPYDSPAAGDVPAKFKDPKHRWAGNALRARVLAVRQPPGQGENLSLQDLLDPKHRGTVGIARPTAGTTGGHVAALYVLWGPQRFAEFMTRLKANGVKLLGGNGPGAEAVGRGELTIGLTDNDDVAAVARNGGTIAAVLPDQRDGGTLAIPTTVGLVAGAPNPVAAQKLIDYLLSPEVERRLIAAEFAGWSVRTGAGEAPIGTMDVDFAAAAASMPVAVETAMKILEGRE